MCEYHIILKGSQKDIEQAITELKSNIQYDKLDVTVRVKGEETPTVFLSVAHTNDDDADYFSFSDILECIKYITEEGIEEYRITSIRELPVNDYTFVR